MSNLPAPVAIISMAQQARPNVMGQSADLRAQLTTGAAMSTVFAPTVRRIEFMIESTVVKTNPSSCSAIYHVQLAIADCQFSNYLPAPNRQLAIGNRQSFSRPLQRAFTPGVIIANYQNSDKHKHLEQRKLREGEVVAHEDYRPRQQKDCLDVKNQKQHRDDVVAHGKTFVSFGCRVDAALVRTHLALFILDRSQEPAKDDRQHRKDHSHGKKDHDRPIGCYRAADILCCRRYCLKKHRFPVQEERVTSLTTQNSKRRSRLLSTTVLKDVLQLPNSHQCNFTARSI